MSTTYYDQRKVFSPPAEWVFTESYVFHNTNITFHKGNPVWYSYQSEMMTYEEYSGGGGTTNYNSLSNKPQVNSVTLQGDKTHSDLKLIGLDESSASTDIKIGVTSDSNAYLEI